MIFAYVIFYFPALMTIESAASFPAIKSGLEQILIAKLPGILTAATFLSFYGGTIAILYANIRRIGKTRFWILVTTPIIFFLGTLISLYPEIQGVVPKNDASSRKIIMMLGKPLIASILIKHTSLMH